MIGRLLTATVLAVLAPQMALAQVRDTLPPVPLDTLTVTSLRTPFDAVRAPFAVTTVDREQIQRARPGLALDEALRGVPGVQVDNRFNYALGERISIRGFGARAQFGVRGVKVLLDGIPLTLPDGQTTLNQVDLSALDRAEVLRGPSSALYGNAAGGVILLRSEIPDGVEARAVGGAHGLRRVQASAGDGRSGAHVSHLRYGGYRDWSDADNLRASGQVRVGNLRLIAHGVRYDARNPGSLADTALARDRTQAFANNVRQRTGEEGQQGQLGAVWQGIAGPVQLEAAGYGLARSIDNPIPQTIIDLDRSAGGARVLARAGSEALRWTLGVEADAQRDDRRNFPNRAGVRGDTAVLDQRERVTSVGTFAQLAASIGTRLDVLGSLRYDRFWFGVDDRLVTASNPDDSGTRTLDAASPAVGANLRVAPALNLYANIATAFETPTTTELANQPSGEGGFNPELEPQRTRSWELGAKGRWGNRAAYQVAAYQATLRDALIPFRVPNQDRDFFRNAGSALHRGIEAGVALGVSRGLSAQLAYTYTDARFRDYTVGSNTYDDNQVPGIAPHRWDGRVSMALPASAFLDLDARYASRTPANDANSAHSPDYLVADLRAGAADLRLRRLGIAPFLGVTNLFDTEYNTSVVINAFGGRFFEPGPGRALYVGAEVRWGD